MFRFIRVCYWEGINSKGHRVSGRKVNDQLDSVRAELYHQGIVVTQLKKTRWITFANIRLKTKEIANFSRQLAYLLRSGFPLLDSLRALWKQYTSNIVMQRLLTKLIQSLENGMTLSHALREYPDDFSNLYVHLIFVGEQCGNLVEPLLQLADYQEKMLSIKRSIYKALYYPFSLLVCSMLLMVLLMLFVVPQFEQLFATVGASLPWLTQALIKSTHFLKTYGVTLLLGGFCFGVLAACCKSRIQPWIKIWDHLIFKVPWIGNIIKQAITARFARTLSTALKAGLTILESLSIACELLEYASYKSTLLKARESVLSGVSLDDALSKTQVFSPLFIQAIEVGQLSGNLEENLEEFAYFLENKVHDSVFTMIQFLEPALLIALGLYIGLFMFALYWPIFELGNVVGIV